MRQLTSKIWNYLHSRGICRKPKNEQRTRLGLEVLEDRCVPATASGVVAGVAFLDTNHNGAVNVGEALLPGIAVHLVGTTSQSTAVNVTATTTANGKFNFQNVLPGTYHLTAAPTNALLNSATIHIAAFSVTGGQTVSKNLAFRGQFNPIAISLQQFLTETLAGSKTLGTPGGGTALANFRPNNTPTVKSAIADISVARNAADQTIDLAGKFTDPDFTNSTVTFSITNNGVTRKIKVTLFDATAPQTVTNFFDYVTAHQYDNTIFHRLATSFVLQGGALALANAAGTDLSDIPVHNLKVPNEFGKSNTLGTLAMAQSGGDPNSATNQFFFNLINNASSLDSQKFAVFGTLADSASLTALTKLATTPTKDLSTSTFATNHPTALLNAVPMSNYTGSAATFPGDAVKANYMVINNVTVNKRDEFLTYSIVSNDNTGLVTATLDTTSPEMLKLHFTPNMGGTATITVRATDRYGATVDMTFHVTVANSAPTATVALAPDAPAPNATLTATATGADADGDPVKFTYQWKSGATVLQSTALTSATTDTLDLSSFGPFNPGDPITVTVTPNDGVVNGTAVSSTVNINNPPVIDTINLAPSSPGVTGSTTVTISASDLESDPVTFDYLWTVGGVIERSISNSSSLTDTLDLNTLTGINPGDAIVVTVTPHDGKTTGVPSDAATTV